jgi:hypothetical protein
MKKRGNEFVSHPKNKQILLSCEVKIVSRSEFFTERQRKKGNMPENVRLPFIIKS